MQSRKEQVIRGAFVGGASGFVFGTAAGYLISDSRLCSLVPGYFDTALAHSSAQLNSKLAAATAAQANLLKEKISIVADGVNYLFKDSPKMDIALNAIKSVTNKIPSVANHLPAVGAYVTKTLAVSHPVLTGLSHAAFEISTEVIKAALITTCMEAMNQYKIIPIACVATTLAGAGIGAVVGYMAPVSATKPHSEIKKSFLQSQSLFNDRLKSMPLAQPKHRLNRSRSFS